jgi:hypothetical protein
MREDVEYFFIFDGLTPPFRDLANPERDSVNLLWGPVTS